LYSIKDNQIKPWFDLGVEKVNKKEWLYNMGHPDQVLNHTVNSYSKYVVILLNFIFICIYNTLIVPSPVYVVIG